MRQFIRLFASWLYRYGKANAGMPSIRGSYEAPVPKAFRR